jgi:hypothetical protein
MANDHRCICGRGAFEFDIDGSSRTADPKTVSATRFRRFDFANEFSGEEVRRSSAHMPIGAVKRMTNVFL